MPLRPDFYINENSRCAKYLKELFVDTRELIDVGVSYVFFSFSLSLLF